MSPQPLLATIVVVSGLGAVVMCLLVLRYGFPTGADEPGEGRRRQLVTRLGHAVAAACFAIAAILAAVLAADARPPSGARPHPVAPERDAAEHLDVGDVTARLAALESRMDAMEARVAPLAGRVAEARERVAALAARLEPAPVDSRLQEVESLIRQHADAMGRAAARLRRLEKQQVAALTPPASATDRERSRAAEPATSPRWIPAGERSRAARTSPPAPSPPSSTPETASAPPSPAAAVRQPDGPARPAPGAPPPAPAPAAPAAAPAPARAGVPPKASTPREAEERRAALGERIRDDWRTVRRGFADAGDDLRRALDALRDNLRETLGR